MKQSEVFLKGEGHAWLKRNEAKLVEVNDPVLGAMYKYSILPRRVLEVGCSNGWRLAVIEKKYNCFVEGIDPCYEMHRGESHAQVWNGTADSLTYSQKSNYDLVIYGFCLYLCDPEDYFRIAAEGDRVLTDGGYLIVYDFCNTPRPYKVPYKHQIGIFSHHYDFSKLWLGSPAYSVAGQTFQDETCVIILKKNLKNAFPVEK